MFNLNKKLFVFIFVTVLIVFGKYLTSYADITPVSDRTSQVRDAIVEAVPGVDSADDVTEAHLVAITTLNLRGKGLTNLKTGDFSGLTSLTNLNLRHNNISSLPSGIFDELISLTGLNLDGNSLTSLPSGVFDNNTALTELYLYSNEFASFPRGVFDRLTALTTLDCSFNDLASLRSGVFDNNTALTTLELDDNVLTSLPSGIFDNLTSLINLELSDNVLTSLPSGIFDNLTSLTNLYLSDTSISNISELDGLTSLTFLTLYNNSISDISALEDLTSLTRLYLSGNSISDYGPLRRLVAAIEAAGRSLELDITIPSILAGRTPEVRDAIVGAVPGVNSASDVTQAHLAAITALSITRKQNLTLLKSGDFDGLTALASLNLQFNKITSLPSGIFDNLTALTRLDLNENALSSLPADIFDELTTLRFLRLDNNDLSSLPADIFDELTTLEYLYLNSNDLTTLPSGIFDNNTVLTLLHLSSMGLSSLPSGIFEGLTALTNLYLHGNSVNPLPLTISLKKVGTDQFKAVAPTGAPFDIVVPISVTNGSINGGATTLTIPAGSVGSEVLTVIRTPGVTYATTVYIGTLPNLPANHAGYSLVKSVDLPLSFPELGGQVFLPVSERTPQVRDLIVASVPGINNAADVTEAHLASITGLNLYNKSITSLKSGDFSGLSSLTTLYLNRNALTSFPEDVFSGLSSLTRLWLDRNALTSLPEGVFSGLSSLTTLSLFSNALTSLPEGVFSGLSSLSELNLGGNGLTSLPAGVFSGLSSLTRLFLGGNGLTSLPAGVFSGLSSLTGLELVGNSIDPLPLTISLEKVGIDQFKAVAPAGAPFEIVVPLRVRNGEINGGATTLTIPAGSVESDVLSVTRTPGATYATTVYIGTLPNLPANHAGYSLVKSVDLPLSFPELGGQVFLPVSERTPQVRDLIVASVPGINNAADVTEAHLASITGLNLYNKSITSLKSGDFSGLSSLTTLYLNRNALTSFPEDVFSGLSSLTRLWLDRNALTSLPEGVFSGLSSLTTLSLFSNALTSLPEGVFSGLSSLSELNLGGNGLTSLPAGVFSGLSSLTRLFLGGNGLTSLPAGVFSGLSSLTGLELVGNSIDPLPLTISLEKVGIDQFKAVAPTGAPFDIVLPLTVTDGSISGGATTLTILAGSVESDVLTVTRTPDTTGAVTVNIGTLPNLPSDHLGYTLVKSADLPLSYALPEIRTFLGSRTPQVRDAIVAAVPGVNSAADVTEAHLAGIVRLFVDNENITALKEGDFDGLTSLTAIELWGNSLTSLPEGVFSGLSSLTRLNLWRNSLTSLPEGVFSGLSSLTELFLSENPLTSLPEGVFSGLSSLTHLSLNHIDLTSLPEGVFSGLSSLTELTLWGNSLTSLPEGVFSGLPSLTGLYLSNNSLTSLPEGVFSGLSLLTRIDLSNNSLTSLPEGVFSGLSTLTTLNLHRNSVDPLPLTISLEKVGTDQFKTVAPTGAPFDIVLPLRVSNGSINGGTTSVTIPTGSTESEVLNVTRTPDTMDDVTVDIGTLPSLPSGHTGYGLVKSADLPLNYALPEVRSLVGSRTPQVRDAIVAAVPGVNSAADVTEAHLAGIVRLFVDNENITALKEGDFDGLTSLTAIELWGNSLTSLPEGVFSGLSSLTRLNLWRNSLTSLPEGVFSGLSSLTELFLSENPLTSLPEGVFSGLSSLTHLSLNHIDLTSLPEGVFSGLSSLTELTLWGNSLTSLPEGVFSGLPSLTGLYLSNNSLTSLPEGVFSGLSTLTTLNLHRNSVDPLPLTISLEKVGIDQFKAVAPTGAPFDIVLPLTVTDGSISGGATTLTILAGSVESDVLTVTRTPDTTVDVTVNIGNPLPSLPANHTGYALVKSADLPLSYALPEVPSLIGNRTPQVRDAIVAAVPGVNNSADVTEAHLAAIRGSFILDEKGITKLKPGDFSGLTSVTHLYLRSNNLTTLPAGVFDGLTSTTFIGLSKNQLSTLPAGVFDGLTSLLILDLEDNHISTLPVGIFDGLNKLLRIWLRDNHFSTLPVGIFDGLNALEWLYLGNNSVDPLPLTVSLEKVGTDQFKAVSPTGAPFDIVLSLALTNGRVSDGATTITIPLGSVESDVLTVTRTPDTTGAVTVHIGTLPSLPSNHGGYTLAKSADLPLSYALPEVRSLIGSLTPQVQDAIVAALPGVNSVNDVTEAHLATITHLNLRNKGILTLKVGDFARLTALTELQLHENQLRTLPANVFSELSSLNTLYLHNNPLTNLPSGVFNGLTKMTNLYLYNNQITTLPQNLFSGLSSLKQINIHSNRLTSIHPDAFSGLPSLTQLFLRNNRLTSLPQNVFSGLSKLQYLYLDGNQLTSIPAGVFSGLSSLNQLLLNGNQLSALPAGIFHGLTGLTMLRLQGNRVDPMSLTVSLVKVGTNQFKATVPAGAPFAIILPVNVANGNISGGATTLTIPQGAVESVSLTVTRTVGTTAAVTVDIGTLPGLPTNHQGYALVKSSNLPLEVLSAPSNIDPVFTDGVSATRTIAENTASGVNIGNPIAATDVDNDTLAYSLSGTDAAAFSIVSSSGQLQTNAALDYETKINYTVTITVSDGNLTDTITVTITITDIDEPPTIVGVCQVGDILAPGEGCTYPDSDAVFSVIGNGKSKWYVPGLPNWLAPWVNRISITNSLHITSTVNDKTYHFLAEAVANNSWEVKEIGDVGTQVPIQPDDTDDTQEPETPTQTESQVSGVNIPDANLRAKIESALGKTAGDPITATEMATLTTLNAQDARITNLAGLETATNLTTLKLGNNTISNISELSGLTNLTELQLWDNQITNISNLSGLTNLTTLFLWGNSISDISQLSGLTSLTQLRVGENNISNISTVSNLTNLTQLYLNENTITDISAITGLTNLTELRIGDNTISDITPVQNLTNLEWLDIPNNSISDISAVQNLTSLVELYFQNNSVSDLSPLVANTGFGEFTELDAQGNPLSYPSIYTYIPALQAKDVYIDFDNRVATVPVKISGDTQQGETGATLTQPFIVEVKDSGSVVFAGVPVTFAITASGGTLSATNTTTDVNGRAQTTLTLGDTAGTNTVSVSVAGVTQTITFTAAATAPVVVYITPVGDRTSQVAQAILGVVRLDYPTVSNYADITATHIASPTALYLNNRNITTLKSGDFDGLTGLEDLRLNNNQLTSLPSDIFSGLTSLSNLNLFNNQLSSLPDGIFEGLTSLTKIRLARNAVDPLPVTVSLEKVAEGQFKAVAPTGATFTIVLPINVANGSITGGATTLTIQQGSLESDTLNVTRTAGTTANVTVDIGTLPSLPRNHFGYALAKSDDLPLAVITRINTAPVFTDGSAVTRTVPENTTAGANLGAPIAATDTENDTLTYTLSGDPDASAFDIDSTTGQLKTKATLDYETKSTYTVTITVSDGSLTGTITVTINITDIDEAVVVDPPTTNVAPTFTDGESTTRIILENSPAGTNIGNPMNATDTNNDTLTYSIGGVDAASFDIDSTTGQLKTKASLDYETKRIYSVTITAADDELSGTITVIISVIDVNDTVLSSGFVPVADRTPQVRDAIVAAVPNVTDAEAVTESQVAAITSLNLRNKGISSLKTGDFSGMTALTTLNLFRNQLSELPPRIFENLSALTTLRLGGNTVGPLPLIVSLQSVGTGEFKAVITTGAPFSMVLPITVTNGSISSGITSVTIPQGSSESASFTVIGTSAKVFFGTLPGLPAKHYGYTLAQSNVCNRTTEVADAIAAAVGVSDCSDVTETDLATITRLDLSGSAITSLQTGDFDGMFSLRTLYLENNNLTSLPNNIFDDLVSLTFLSLNENKLTTLPSGIFSKLTSLTHLDIFDNDMNSLPNGVFTGLSALTSLSLKDNELTNLPSNIFNGLSSVTSLSVSNNKLTSLPAGIFNGLVSVNQLQLNGNPVDPLPLVISLQKVGTNQFKAVALSGTPFALVLPITITNGTVTGGETTITIQIGTVESQTLTITRTAGAVAAVTADIGTVLPRLPSNHNGYALVKSRTLPLEVLPPLNSPPVFTEGASTTRTISENTATGINIGDAITATDVNTADTLTYTLSGTDAAAFDIDSTTGQLTTKVALDYETKNAYSVTLTVSDSIATGTIGVTINILNVNEAPVFAAGSLTTHTVAENTASGENIGTAYSATDVDGDTLTYSLSGQDAAAFDIDSTTGQLTTKVALDYETKNAYSVTLTVSDSIATGTIGVTINILNVNEAPVFAAGSLTTHTVAENTASGENIGTAYSATDVDGDTLTYSLSGQDAAAFDIDSTTGQLTTKVALDYETKTIYSVTIVVSDTGLTDTITVTINITDVDELPTVIPVCQVGNVLEPGQSCTYPGTDIEFTVNNSGSGSFLFFTSGNSINIKDSVINGKRYTLVVEKQSDNSWKIEEVGTSSANNAPVFTDGETATRTVVEDTPSGVDIGTAVSATDADGHTIEYTLGGTDADKFSIDSTNGQLRTSAPLDYETKSTYTVTITTNDGTDDTTITVTINVINKTENRAPVFADGTSTSRSVAEDAGSGIDIGSAVAATDADGDTLTYTLGGTDAASFSIDSTTGQLRTNTFFDYETKTSYTVTITVSDGTLTDSITVTINITDIDETPSNSGPVFSEGSSTSRTVTENTGSGVDIGSAVSATDDDGDTVSYSLSGTDASSFSIDSSSGQIRTSSSLNYETKDSHSVTVNVSDGSLTDSIDVTINVTDVNDAPVFTAGSSTTRSIAENTAANVNIGTAVSATDDDADTLTYTLGGIDAASFSIVSTSGQLQTKVALDYETKTSYAVTITVSDGSLTDSITVTINVTDVSENSAPAFSAGASISNISATKGTAITSVTLPAATDADDDTITYTLTPALPAGLTFTASTRVLSGTPTAETASATYTYKASDGALSDTLTFTIQVSAVANNAPVFTDGTSTTRSVAENTASDTNIGTAVAATDADNDTLTYTLSGTDEDSFSIVSTSGQLQTSAALDYETKTSYSVTVSVSDGNGGSDSIDVMINVTDVNETITPVNERTQQVQDAIVAAVNGIDSADDVTATHLAAITRLDLGSKSISSLKSGDFDDLTALTTLWLSRNSISDISAVSGLTSLTELYLNNNSISDISAVSGLTSLTTLWLDFNSSSDISAVSGLTSLTTLSLYGNSISDISAVSGLTSLTSLGLHINSISDISAVSGLTSLTWLGLNNNSISDISAVSGLTSLTTLWLRDNSISDISAVSGLTSLTTLWLRNNSISDISAVSGLTSLTELGLSDNSISDVSALERLTSLSQLELSSNPISDYAPLRTLVAAIEADGRTLDLDITIPPAAPAISNPTQTSLLPNYPNPFNPETWIPYQLSKPSDVILTFYNVQGKVVRQLALGHRAAGVYYTRSRAAHWDGKNNLGEKVSTGVYFVKFKAGNYTKTRKMLIRK